VLTAIVSIYYISVTFPYYHKPANLKLRRREERISKMDLEEYRNQVVPFDRTLHRIFSNLVEVQVSPWMDTPCWVYKRHYERGQDRYYMRSLDGKDGGLVHRYLYQKLVEELPIDDIYHVAHLCHQKSCNRVDGHLLAVKPRENVLAVDGPKGCYAENYYKTECVKGHPYTDENTSYSYLGSRICRQCYEDGKKAR